jgi:hypothetical protein
MSGNRIQAIPSPPLHQFDLCDNYIVRHGLEHARYSADCDVPINAHLTPVLCVVLTV